MPDELKPCPWCGNAGAIYDSGEPYFIMVECQSCHKCVLGDSGNAEDAISAWNTLPRVPKGKE